MPAPSPHDEPIRLTFNPTHRQLHPAVNYDLCGLVFDDMGGGPPRVTERRPSHDSTKRRTPMHAPRGKSPDVPPYIIKKEYLEGDTFSQKVIALDGTRHLLPCSAWYPRYSVTVGGDDAKTVSANHYLYRYADARAVAERARDTLLDWHGRYRSNTPYADQVDAYWQGCFEMDRPDIVSFCWCLVPAGVAPGPEFMPFKPEVLSNGACFFRREHLYASAAMLPRGKYRAWHCRTTPALPKGVHRSGFDATPMDALDGSRVENWTYVAWWKTPGPDHGEWDGVSDYERVADGGLFAEDSPWLDITVE